MNEIAMECQKASHTDAKKIASLHAVAFSNFFLTSLGMDFLETFYRCLLQSDEGLGIIIYDNEELIGFAVGTTQTQGFYKDLVLRNGVILVLSCLKEIILNPMRLVKLIIKLRNGVSLDVVDQGGWLLSICVNPDYENRGIGKILLKSFEVSLSQKEVKKIWLTTDKSNNTNVNLFYKKMGYNVSDSLLSNGRLMNLYVKEI